MIKVIKRDCTEDTFKKEKISTAILKAMKNGSGIVKPKIAESIANEIEEECKDREEIDISEIEAMVFDKLITKKQRLTARAYEGYRSTREFQRENENTVDTEISELLSGTSDYWKNENSNKNPRLNTTQRDYLAGIVSTDAARRYILPPEIVQGDADGIIHVHDKDYLIQSMTNCFSGDTKFITNYGVKSFNYFYDGDVIQVKDKDGIWREATVRNYGKKLMYDVTFKTPRSYKTVTCTKDHRWILKDGTVTTNLKVGDCLYTTSDTTQYEPKTYDEKRMFCFGFSIGDGSDRFNGQKKFCGIRVRLCGHKNDYKNYFIESGYSISQQFENGDIVLCNYKEESKQTFLSSFGWRMLPLNLKIALFHGYYAADGHTGNYGVDTIDTRIVNMIDEISALAGYYIQSKKEHNRNTNYSNDCLLYCYRFSVSQPVNWAWKVVSIEPHYKNNRPMSAWCVEEPITHSFLLDNGIVTGNCCLINLEDMLQNGTVISETLIEKPHSFSTACTVATQIIAQVASSQYGGQSVSLAHLAPFVDISRQKIRKEVIEEQEYLYRDIDEKEWVKPRKVLGKKLRKDQEKFYKNKDKLLKFIDATDIEDIVEKRLKKEIEKGIQTIQYQITTLMTTNGQAPFITLFMYLNEAKNQREKDDLAMLIEEELKQSLLGVKNEKGVYITPAFPKVIYVLQEDNIEPGSKYYYLTELAAKCSIKRLTPDYISEKIMKEMKDGNCYPVMGCRSALTVWHDENGNPKFYGRFNCGVVTVSLPDIALSSGGDMEEFWKIFDERTELCHKALKIRHQRLRGVTSDVAPILWQNGAYARLGKGETIDKLLFGGYSTLSLGYAGLYECVKYMTGRSHFDEGVGEKFGLEVMQALNDKCSQWREEENIDYSLYGTPLEATTEKFAKKLKERFGIIEGITDRNYVTNSYHIPVFEQIDAFEKLRIEAKFQRLSPGGSISYIECPNIEHNMDAVIEVIKFIYNNNMYAELNTKSDYCQKCGWDKEINLIDEDGQLIWECPNCGNRDVKTMDITRRTCGYKATARNGWNQGRLGDIRDRVEHLDNFDAENN